MFDATRDESRQAEDRLDDELARVLPDGCTPRFVLTKRNLAPGSQIGGYVLSKALPLMILLMVLLGAFYPAIDVTAGERERGTLETILTSPIARIDLLLGKILAVTVLASLSGVVNLGSMTLTLVQVVNLGQFARPLDVATEPSGLIYVAEYEGNRVSLMIPQSLGACPSRPSSRAVSRRHFIIRLAR